MAGKYAAGGARFRQLDEYADAGTEQANAGTLPGNWDSSAVTGNRKVFHGKIPDPK